MSGSTLPGPTRFAPIRSQPLPGPVPGLFQWAGVIGTADVVNFTQQQELDGTPRGFAKHLVQCFARRLGPHVFAHLDRQRVADGLLARIDDPGLINQGAGSLCGPSALLFDVATRDPIHYGQFAIDLFERGIGYLGELEIEPGADLREYPLPPGALDECDWLTLASIRDSENWFFDYDDVESIFEGVSGMTPPNELAGWFERLGYREVLNETSIFFHHSQQHAERASHLYRRGYRVCLLINAKMLYADQQDEQSGAANHWVALNSAITLSPFATRCEVFSWGEGHRHVPEGGGVMAMSSFLEHYHGFVACRF